jgi:hypothetical protein
MLHLRLKDAHESGYEGAVEMIIEEAVSGGE